MPPGSSFTWSASAILYTFCRRSAPSISLSRTPTLRSWSGSQRPLRASTVFVPSRNAVTCRFGRTTRTRKALAAIRTVAPMSPPSNELSGPMMAFCTTFDSSSITIRSKELSCARSRFPASRRSTMSAQ